MKTTNSVYGSIRAFCPQFSVAYCGILCLGVLVGCTQGPKAAPQIALDASDSSAKAFELYDKDEDGLLSKKELAESPGLNAASKKLDTDGNGQISPEELTARIQSWISSSTRFAEYECMVKLDGQPLQGAVIKFIPDSFLSDGLKPASGETSKAGIAVPSLSKDDLPEALKNFRGMQQGIYRVEITHPKHEIRAEYNTKTTLGCEINSARLGGMIHFSIKSR